MYVQQYRPSSFAEVRGVKVPLALLKNICKNPTSSPRNLLFFGSPGVGKTTCARILPKALNCKRKPGDACGNCPSCQSIASGGDPRYREYDVSYVGQVDIMRQIGENIQISLEAGYQVVVFDEMQMASKEAQSSLLKILDESQPDTFFVFCTTQRDKVLDTIQSRCIPLDFGKLDVEDIKTLIRETVEREDFELSPNALRVIMRRSDGDARAALNLLQNCQICGEEEFLVHNVLLDEHIKKMLNLLLKQKDASTESQLHDIVRLLVSSPVEYLRQDFERVMVEAADLLYIQKQEGILAFEYVLQHWLTYQQYMRTTNDWYIFLLGLPRAISAKKAGLRI